VSEEAWLAARLIPTSGINGSDEQERRATSALLAVMSSVREFGRAIVQPLGAPAGSMETFIEVPFKIGDKQCFPDGLIRIVRGQRQWTALVEVKTAGNVLTAEQLERYLDVARENNFDALVRFASLKLGRQLGIEVIPALSRRDLAEPSLRTQALVTQLTTTGSMTGGLKIPGAIGPLQVTADIRAGKIICSVDIDAPKEGRSTTRINWLSRQLRNAPESLIVEAFALHARGPGIAELLKVVRETPAAIAGDSGREIKSFRIAQSSAAGTKRGTGRGAFIDSFLAAIDDFYAQVVQNLKPWMPAPPRLRSADEPSLTEPVSPSLVSTAISSQDGPVSGPGEGDGAGEPMPHVAGQREPSAEEPAQPAF
jgi:hypothetical protein